jgi:GDPmannose 4,6-dehydratase
LYRARFGITIDNLILFNHESTRRPESYFVPIVGKALRACLTGEKLRTRIKTLNFFADWSRAEDLAHCVAALAKNRVSTDFVFGSGRTNFARGLISKLFELQNFDYRDFLEETEPGTKINDFFEVDASRLQAVVGFRPRQDTESIFTEFATVRLDNANALPTYPQ